MRLFFIASFRLTCMIKEVPCLINSDGRKMMPIWFGKCMTRADDVVVAPRERNRTVVHDQGEDTLAVI